MLRFSCKISSSTLKGGHRDWKKRFFKHNNRHLLTDGVFANYSRKKSENDFSKLTDGHLDSRNLIIQVGDKSGRKRVSKESLTGSPSSSLSPAPAPPSPIATWSVFLRSLQFFARPHYLKAWNRLVFLKDRNRTISTFYCQMPPNI